MKNILCALILIPLVLFSMTFFAGCTSSHDKKTKYVYMYVPGSKFTAGTATTALCSNSSYPLSCPSVNLCCPTGYPYYCPSDNQCWTSPSCSSSYITCSAGPVSITSVTQSQTTITTGGTITFTVYFTVSTYTVTEIYVYITELGGYFDIPVSATDSASGVTTFDMAVSTDEPDTTSCANRVPAGCPSYQVGSSCWCAEKMPESVSNASVDVSLLDNNSDVSPSYPLSVGIINDSGNNSTTCSVGQYSATCPDNTTRCCSTNMVCCYDSMNGDAIGCEFSGFCDKEMDDSSKLSLPETPAKGSSK